LIAAWARQIRPADALQAPLVVAGPASALALADDLARLMDDMTTRKVEWQALDELVREERSDLDEYWQLSLKLLRLVREKWPQMLAERRVIEPAERRDRLIAAEAARLARSDAPVIAAGSTGSMPATAMLLEAIARHRHGALVLPGVDMALDEPSWRLIAGDAEKKISPAYGHAQFSMQALLTRIGVAREKITQLAPAGPREAFVSDVLRPALTTDKWQAQRRGGRLAAQSAAQADAALSTMTVIEAGNAEQEALAIAVALREAIETQGKTAALVTPDRDLARRVMAALDRWEVKVDDSGGDKLADTPAGLFARLAAQSALRALEPVPLLALLKHPLLRLGGRAIGHQRGVAALERAVLRGPRPKSGIAGLSHALATFQAERGMLHPNDPRKSVSDGDLEAARALVDALGTALAPLTGAAKRAPLATLAQCHQDCVIKLASEGKDTIAFTGSDGEKLARAFEGLIDSSAAASLSISAADYPDVVLTALRSRSVRMREQAGVRIRIFGPLEARLQSIDCMVLGGLNEASWPPDVRTDPWLSRPMRLALGLDLPERRIGLAAHDFAQALGAPEVIITRATRTAGAPTVSSRFLQRVAALAGPARWSEALARGQRYVALAAALDAPSGKPQQVQRPEPSPALDIRPNKLSVTDIENWLRDPYTIYAKHVLRLFPLDAVNTPPGAADRGSVIHQAIGDFTKQFAAKLPADTEQELIELGEKSFAPLEDYPEARAFWWPRFKRIARWFADWERKRRPQLAAVYGEIRGELDIRLDPTRTFTLTARADRIELRHDKTYAILDYKTGAPPTEPQVRSGMAPQLTLEAAILRGGGFAGIAAGSVALISYVRLRGGEPAGEPKEIKFTEGTTDSQADRARDELTKVAARFLIGGEPYRSLVHPMWQKHYGEYDHLARVKEWGASGGESEYVGPPT
jgi:ATP-dependent helicase/nuclease subunit B